MKKNEEWDFGFTAVDEADLGLSNEPATATLAEAVDCCPSTKVFTGIGMVFVTG